MPCEVVLLNRENKAWFLASMESLRGSCGISMRATSHPLPEYIPAGPGGANSLLHLCRVSTERLLCASIAAQQRTDSPGASHNGAAESIQAFRERSCKRRFTRRRRAF